jgi:hypothetical protein
LLAALLGEEPQFGMHHMANPGPAVQELVRRFVLPAATAAGPRPAAEQLAAETVGAPPPAAEPSAAEPPNPPSSDRHNCHTPAAAMTPADAPGTAAKVAATPCAAGTSVQPAAAQSAADIPSAAPKNQADMTSRTEPCSVPHTTEHGSVPPSGREPWEDEYERLIEERKTIRLQMGVVVYP